MTDDRTGIRQLSSREVYRNSWLRLREDEVEFPNGSTGIYSVIEKRDFVSVVPYADGGFWLVQQFRYTVGRREWEFPQGGWPVGRTGTPAELAATELREETGLRAGALTHLGRLHAAPGFATQSYDIYLATDLTAGPPELESTESDLVHEWRSEPDVRSMIRDGTFVDAHCIAALALFDLHRAATG